MIPDRRRPPVPPRRPGAARRVEIPEETPSDVAAVDGVGETDAVAPVYDPIAPAAEVRDHAGVAIDPERADAVHDDAGRDEIGVEPTPLDLLVAALPDGAAFRAALAKPVRRALRRHPLRGSLNGWGEVTAIPWAKDGFFHAPDADPGDRLDYHTGAGYPQDAASQLPVALLAPMPGETIIDVCAAPGSKTTQIGIALGDSGLLLALDAAPARRKVLTENLARQGIANALVLPLTIAALAAKHPRAADAVLVDAPCSGHRDVRARQARRMGERQLGLLAQAALLVRPGGRMVYSTCTPWPDEDETVIAGFLAQHPGWMIDTPSMAGCDADLSGGGGLRLWPQRQGCEPFFACRLRAPGSVDDRAGKAAVVGFSGHLPDHSRAIDHLFPGSGLHRWERGGVLFAATAAAATCALPAESRGLRIGRLRQTRAGDMVDLEPWAAQALIERGAPAVAVSHATACELWAGGTDRGLSAGDLVKTVAGGPLGVAGKDGRLDLPSRLRRSGLR